MAPLSLFEFLARGRVCWRNIVGRGRGRITEVICIAYLNLIAINLIEYNYAFIIIHYVNQIVEIH